MGGSEYCPPFLFCNGLHTRSAKMFSLTDCVWHNRRVDRLCNPCIFLDVLYSDIRPFSRTKGMIHCIQVDNSNRRCEMDNYNEVRIGEATYEVNRVFSDRQTVSDVICEAVIQKVKRQAVTI